MLELEWFCVLENLFFVYVLFFQLIFMIQSVYIFLGYFLNVIRKLKIFESCKNMNGCWLIKMVVEIVSLIYVVIIFDYDVFFYIQFCVFVVIEFNFMIKNYMQCFLGFYYFRRNNFFQKYDLICSCYIGLG